MSTLQSYELALYIMLYYKQLNYLLFFAILKLDWCKEITLLGLQKGKRIEQNSDVVM